jgi:hypothetical protein
VAVAAGWLARWSWVWLWVWLWAWLWAWLWYGWRWLGPCLLASCWALVSTSGLGLRSQSGCCSAAALILSSFCCRCRAACRISSWKGSRVGAAVAAANVFDVAGAVAEVVLSSEKGSTSDFGRALTLTCLLPLLADLGRPGAICEGRMMASSLPPETDMMGCWIEDCWRSPPSASLVAVSALVLGRRPGLLLGCGVFLMCFVGINDWTLG